MGVLFAGDHGAVKRGDGEGGETRKPARNKAQNDESPVRRPGFLYLEPQLSGDLGEFD